MSQFTFRDIGYTIVSRFEGAFRLFLLDNLLGEYSDVLSGLPRQVVDRAEKRGADTEDPLSVFEHIDFSDLVPIACYKKSYRRYFPNAPFEQPEFENKMAHVYSLRNKIAHIREGFTSLDLQVLIDAVEDISRYLGIDGKEVIDFLYRVRNYPTAEIWKMPSEFALDTTTSTILNNLPTADYELEGGFVGRREDKRKIKQLLKGGLHRVITISGAGGVGKTALALNVVKEIAQETNSEFDGIIWVSAKETRLSYVGIEEIEPTLKNYEQLVDTIIEVMGYEGGQDDLSVKEDMLKQILASSRCILVIIDNLETIHDRQITEFILDAPSELRILITSRRGLGQVERRYELKQMKQRDAIRLFRQIAHEKNLVSLSRLPDDTIAMHVKKVAHYPLAIKWMIGQVALGKPINRVINEIHDATSDISRFSFEQIYRSLSPQAQRVLCALSILDESPSVGVLQYIVNLEQEQFDDAIRELVLVSLIVPEAHKDKRGDVTTQYTLLSLTRGYVQRQLNSDASLKHSLVQRLQSVQAVIEEAERASKQYRYSLANLGAVTDEEKVAAMLAQTAFQKYQMGRYADAIDDYRRAVKIAPRLAALYRNWAIMESNEKHSAEAEELMRKATSLASDDVSIWLTWGNIKRKENKIKDALQKYGRAYQLEPQNPIVLNALGQAKSRLGYYENAYQLFAKALQFASNNESDLQNKRNRIINLSSQADNLIRWAESLRHHRDFEKQEDKLLKALKICEDVVELDKRDQRSQDLLRKALINLGYFYKQARDFSKAQLYFERVVDILYTTRQTRFSEARDILIAAIQSATISLEQEDKKRAQDIINKVPSAVRRRVRTLLKNREQLLKQYQSVLDRLAEKDKRVLGRVIRVNSLREFVIIESHLSAGDTYLGHISSFLEDVALSDLYGVTVSFIPEEVEYGDSIKKRAKRISVEPDVNT